MESAVFVNALVNKVGIFVLAAMSLYFGYRLLGDIELQKLKAGESITTSFGRQMKIAGTKLLPGSAFIIAAAIMVVVAYRSEIRVETKSGEGVLVIRGLGPDITTEQVARRRLTQTLDTVLGALNSPSTQLPEADVRALRDARPDLEKLRDALKAPKP